MSGTDIKLMHREKLSLLIFIVSVCQIYLVRDVREIFNLVHYSKHGYIEQIFLCSKALMVLGITLSLYQRIKVKIIVDR